MKYDDICNKLIKEYGGSRANDRLCMNNLEDGLEFMFGISFRNPEENYKLLTEREISSLSHQCGGELIRKGRSIFDDLLLIFYKEPKGDIGFKIMNGMAGRLALDMCHLCDHPEIFGQ